MTQNTLLNSFAADVARDLQLTPKQLQSRYLYDPLGSSLFDAICELPWYRITRAEAGLLARHAGDIAAHMGHPSETAIVELGVGNGEKLATLVGALPPTTLVNLFLIDISEAALDRTSARLSNFHNVAIERYQGTYEEALELAALDMRDRGRRLMLFLGSNIGNFDAAGAAHGLMCSMRKALEPGDHLLLGADLVKPASELFLAYDDPLGVTAAFNKNLLVRINRELGGDFDLAGFAHRAEWNAAEHRIEMQLVSRRRQDVRIAAAGLRVHFEPGEIIWTESYKYDEAAIARLGSDAGFSIADQWIDPEARFALTLFRAS